MEAPFIVKQTWKQLFTALTARFNSEGYVVISQKHNDEVYHSCYVIWSNNVDALRLTWDGKESWFLLEEAELPISAITLWRELSVVPFNPHKHDHTYADNVVHDILNHLD